MQKFIEPFQFITHDITGSSHVEQARKACEAGCKWVQYRCLSKSDNMLLQDIHAIAEICDDWGSTLIVTDHIHLAGQADIQGFHMEDPGTDIRKIRDQLGEAFTIGGTALQEAGLIALAEAGADYSGFGPFGPSTTKPNPHPLISAEAYRNACAKLRDLGHQMPVIAVGGIKASDLAALRHTRIYGVAVSSALNMAADFDTAVSEFKEDLNFS